MNLRLLTLALVFTFAFAPARAQVTLDTKGWTQAAVIPGATLIHVDPAGNDSNPGTSASPKRTIKKGYDALPTGTPARLRLRSGAIFNEVFPQWLKSGESPSRPMVVEVYGGAAPAKIRGAANQTAFHSYGSAGLLHDVLVRDLDFEPVGRNGSEGPRGLEILAPVSNFTFEGCRWSGFATNGVLQGAYGKIKGPVRFRRCVFSQAWSTGSEHSQGLYVDGAEKVEVFECAFIHNGFSSRTSRAGADVFRHGVYVQNGEPASFTGCLFADNSSHGLQLRGGGKVIACLFIGNPISLLVGGGNTPSPTGVKCEVRGCVILNGADIDAQNPRGWGVDLSNISDGVCSDTYMAHQGGHQPSGMHLGSGFGIGVRNLRLERNTIHQDWGAGFGIDDPAKVTNLTESNNHFLATPATLVNPGASVQSATGLSSTAYLALIDQQGPSNWMPKAWPQGGIIRYFMASSKQK